MKKRVNLSFNSLEDPNQQIFKQKSEGNCAQEIKSGSADEEMIEKKTTISGKNTVSSGTGSVGSGNEKVKFLDKEYLLFEKRYLDDIGAKKIYESLSNVSNS